MNVVDKPWGFYVDLERNPFRVIKRIKVSPNQKLSLQKHKNRSEFWFILSGFGRVTLGNHTFPAGHENHFHIPRNMIHRMEAGPEGIMFLEVQSGDCREDDIIRLKDDYGRVTEGL